MKRNKDMKKSDYFVLTKSNLSSEQLAAAKKRIIEFLPNFNENEHIRLAELDKFLMLKYNAEKVDWKEIDKCTRTGIRKYNKFCKTVFCVSEGLVSDENYSSSYIIKRENCINPSTNKDDYFYDVFIIVGSVDDHPTSYFVGGHSDGLIEEMELLVKKNP